MTGFHHRETRQRVLRATAFVGLVATSLGLVACAQRAPDADDVAAAPAPTAEVRPAQPEATDSVPVAGAAQVADETASPAMPPDGDATPPVPGMDLPSRTTARSSADATHTLPDVPVLRAVRTGAHPDADRLVFEFDGDGLPAWSIEYIDRPQYECGSGEAVRLRGDAWLQIRFIGAAAHTPEGQGTSGPRRRDVGLPNLLELARTCDFEGEVTWIAAVARPDGYTPRALSSPARLAVDIAH